MEWDFRNIDDEGELNLKKFFWKCTACGTCRSGYTYGPPPTFRVICPQGNKFGYQGYYGSKGKAALARWMTGCSYLKDEKFEYTPEFLHTLYSCTECGGCQNQCMIDFKPHIIDTIEAMRAKAVQDGKGPLKEHHVLVMSMKNNDNPYTGPRAIRAKWMKKIDNDSKLKDINKESAPVLYYAGCTPAYNAPVRDLALSTVRVFDKIGLNYGALGKNEVCCGSTVLRIGERDQFERVASKNLEQFKMLHDERGVDTIVTSCAGCYRAFVEDYPHSDAYKECMDGIKVMHTSELLYEKFKNGEWEPTKEVKMKVTYHDPCHLGRHLKDWIIDWDGSKQWKGSYLDCIDRGVFEAPRELIKAIPGIEFEEMKRSRNNSFCCGSGGGIKTAFPDWAAENASLRVEEAIDTGAEMIISCCPFCHANLNDGAKVIKSECKTMDLIELLDQAL
ncbi:MAG: (Fe-S)-binding protein [Candidatus Methanofastidiosa archaeon]|nr:(Fe-S)-binding protein [Candidatus Methanofastidiosa archaeon]